MTRGFNQMIKRFRRHCYSSKNEIRIGAKAVITARTEFITNVTQTVFAIGRITAVQLDDAGSYFLTLEPCEYTKMLNGKGIHTSEHKTVQSYSIDRETIKKIEYIIEKC